MGGIQQPTTNLMKGKNNNINSQQQPTQGLVSIKYSKVTKADVIQVNEWVHGISLLLSYFIFPIYLRVSVSSFILSDTLGRWTQLCSGHLEEMSIKLGEKVWSGGATLEGLTFLLDIEEALHRPLARGFVVLVCRPHPLHQLLHLLLGAHKVVPRLNNDR